MKTSFETGGPVSIPGVARSVRDGSPNPPRSFAAAHRGHVAAGGGAAVLPERALRRLRQLLPSPAGLRGRAGDGPASGPAAAGDGAGREDELRAGDHLPHADADRSGHDLQAVVRDRSLHGLPAGVHAAGHGIRAAGGECPGDAVSVVHSPAIEENFIALSKHEIELKEVDAEKKILMGAALVPNKQILRADKDGNGYYIYFSEDTIKKASELFLMRSNQNNATYEHKEKLNGMSVVESWVIDNPEMDKSKEYGFSLPKGTWMIAMKVNNEDIWKDVKAGKVKGFSIEGYFADKYEMSQEKQDIINQLKELLK